MAKRKSPAAEDFQDPLQNYAPKIYKDPLEEVLAEGSLTSIQHEPYCCVSPETTIEAAIHKLAGLHVACLLVEKDRKLVGVFSDRDVLDKVSLEYASIKDKPVREAMTRNPIFVYTTDSPGTALAVMAVAGYRHVPVLNLNNEVVGIVSPQRVTRFLSSHLSS